MKEAKGSANRRYLRHRIQIFMFLYGVYLIYLGVFLEARVQKLFSPDQNHSMSEDAIVITLVVFALGLSLLFGLYFCNAIIGPIKKMESHLLKTLNGEKLPPIRLRRHDQFKNFAELYNELLEKGVRKK
jgi:hypothetical protein